MYTEPTTPASINNNKIILKSRADPGNLFQILLIVRYCLRCIIQAKDQIEEKGGEELLLFYFDFIDFYLFFILRYSS